MPYASDIDSQAQLLSVVINNQAQSKSSQKDPRHGQVMIDLKTMQRNKPVEKWYSVLPVRTETDESAKYDGSLRIKTTIFVSPPPPLPLLVFNVANLPLPSFLLHS